MVDPYNCLFEEEAMIKQEVQGFGARLAEIRKNRGLSQTELGQRIGVSKRVIVYYERENAQPPGSLLVALAKALRVSSDELLGLKPSDERVGPRTSRFAKRLQKIESLPASDQRAILKILDAFIKSRNLAFQVGKKRSGGSKDAYLAKLRKVATR
jgi:transcriptional regulator with XRE-family HTH domain